MATIGVEGGQRDLQDCSTPTWCMWALLCVLRVPKYRNAIKEGRSLFRVQGSLLCIQDNIQDGTCLVHKGSAAQRSDMCPERPYTCP